MKLKLSLAVAMCLMSAIFAAAQSPATDTRQADLAKANELTSSIIRLYQGQKFKEALPLAKEALRLRTSHLAPQDVLVRAALNNLAELNTTLGKFHDAESALKRIVDSYGNEVQDDARLATVFDRLAVVEFALGNLARAEEWYQKALQMRERIHGPNHEAVCESLFLLAEFYQFIGRYKEAEASYQRLMKLRESLPPNPEKLSANLERYGCLMRKLKRFDEAKELEDRAFGYPQQLPPGRKENALTDGGVLNGKALMLPKPSYPAAAKTARASGIVIVRVRINETGRVVSACAVSGHPMLVRPSEISAYGARFSPTKLSGKPVEVMGVITYNYVHQ